MFNLLSGVGFIGAGRAGSALAAGLRGAGYRVEAVASRSPESARSLAARLPGTRALSDGEAVVEACDVVFLTVPDDAIASVARVLPWRPGQGAVHCSGALSLAPLREAAERGAVVGACHPLQTFPSRESGADLLSGSTFALETEGPLGPWLGEMAQRLGGRAIALGSEHRALYHAAAVLSCGYVSTILAAACRLWEAMGFSQEEALEALMPLARGTLANIADVGPAAAATGPIMRGDLDTVRRHLDALAERAPEGLALYCQMGLAMVGLAVERGSLDEGQAERLRELFRSYEPTVVTQAQGKG